MSAYGDRKKTSLTTNIYCSWFLKHGHAGTCARTYTHTHTHTHTHTCTHTRAHTHTRACTHTCTHIHTYVHMLCLFILTRPLHLYRVQGSDSGQVHMLFQTVWCMALKMVVTTSEQEYAIRAHNISMPMFDFSNQFGSREHLLSLIYINFRLSVSQVQRLVGQIGTAQDSEEVRSRV